jgi:hypothetical protein
MVKKSRTLPASLNKPTPKQQIDFLEPELFEVEKLLRTVKQNGQTLVEVKWKGYNETTLEPLEKIRADVPKLVKKFLKE